MPTTAPTATTAQGIAVRTLIKAGYHAEQHAEGIVVSTALKAGQIEPNHAESLAR